MPASGAQSLDSFGRQPQNGAKPGKGQGKGDSGKGGNWKEDRICHNCDKKGNIARDCRSAKRVKGAGKGADRPGRRYRGEDSKWYRRTVDSWVLEEDQQDQPWSEEAGSLEISGLGSGFDEEYLGLNDALSLEVYSCCANSENDGYSDVLASDESIFTGAEISSDYELARDEFLDEAWTIISRA